MSDPSTATDGQAPADGNPAGLLWSLGAFALFILLLVVMTYFWTTYSAQSGGTADGLTETFKALGPWAVLASILLMIVLRAHADAGGSACHGQWHGVRPSRRHTRLVGGRIDRRLARLCPRPLGSAGLPSSA